MIEQGYARFLQLVHIIRYVESARGQVLSDKYNSRASWKYIDHIVSARTLKCASIK